MVTRPNMIEMVRPAERVPGPPQGRWTYADYAALPEDGRRYKVVDGVPYRTAAPGIPHQQASKCFVFYLTKH